MCEVSVIMSVYNEPIDFLTKSVDSILNQTFKDLEFIIVIDNPKHFDAIEYLLNLSDDRIRIIVNEQNYGLPKSLNIALADAKGKYLARMDADDISVPERVEKQIDYLKRYDLDLCASYLITIDEHGEELGREKIFRLSSLAINKLLNIRSPLPHPTWFAKSELFVELGGYRDFHGCEDYDFLLRGKLAQKKFGLVPDYLLFYRQNSQSISNLNSYKQFVSANILKKHRNSLNKLLIDQFNREVKAKLSDNKSRNFAEAKKLLRSASNEPKKINKIFRIFCSIFISPSIFNMYLVSFQTSIIRNLDSRGR